MLRGLFPQWSDSKCVYYFTVDTTATHYAYDTCIIEMYRSLHELQLFLVHIYISESGSTTFPVTKPAWMQENSCNSRTTQHMKMRVLPLHWQKSTHSNDIPVLQAWEIVGIIHSEKLLTIDCLITEEMTLSTFVFNVIYTFNSKLWLSVLACIYTSWSRVVTYNCTHLFGYDWDCKVSKILYTTSWVLRIFTNIECVYCSPSNSSHEEAAAIMSTLSGILVGGISAG